MSDPAERPWEHDEAAQAKKAKTDKKASRAGSDHFGHMTQPSTESVAAKLRRWFLNPAPTTDAERTSRTSRRSHDLRVLMLVLGAVALLIVYQIATEDGDDSTSVAGKYDQTWAQTYSSTMCAEWNAVMTLDQQRAAAADMLTSARNKGDGGIGQPPDSLVDAFRGGITTACVIDTMNIAEVGAGLYLTERARFAPS